MSETEVQTRRGRPKLDEPRPVDLHVGARVRLRRSMMGMSQEKLGEALGLTFQQVQKYERGTNRISASRLWDVGRVLNVPVSFFFEGMVTPDAEDDGQGKTVPMSMGRETSRLVVAFNNVKSGPVRQAITQLVTALADHGNAD